MSLTCENKSRSATLHDVNWGGNEGSELPVQLLTTPPDPWIMLIGHVQIDGTLDLPAKEICTSRRVSLG